MSHKSICVAAPLANAQASVPGVHFFSRDSVIVSDNADAAQQPSNSQFGSLTGESFP
jgi:hypothetical protein